MMKIDETEFCMIQNAGCMSLFDLVNYVQNLVYSLGYFGVFLGVFLEAIFPPIPSELILGLSGMLVGQGKFNFILVLMVAVIANFCSSSLMWWIGRRYGMRVLVNYGRFVGVEKEEIEKGMGLFDKHGYKIVFASQLMPILRTIIAFPAGLSNSVYWKFILANSTGATVWFTILLSLGVYFGQEYDKIQALTKPFEHIILVVLVLLLIAYIYYQIRKFRLKKAKKD